MRPVLVLLFLLVVCAIAPAAQAQRVETRVIGGTPAAAGDYPWQVALLDRTQAGSPQFCGGTLVAAQYVLTAAHCSPSSTTTDVRVGSSSKSTGGEVLRVASVRAHPLAAGSASPPRYDLAMLRLESPVSVTSAAPISVVGAAETGWWEVGKMLTVTGWGDTDPTAVDVFPDALQEAKVPRESDATCGSPSSYGSTFTSADMVCAGFATGGTDTCQGDSGGPLIAPDPAVATPSKTTPAHWRLVGVTSWGIGCAEPNRYGVYARLGAPLLGDWTSTAPPVSTTAPTLSGTAAVGSTLTCAQGSWGGGSAYFTFRFLRRSATGVVTFIRGSVSPSYTVTSADASSTIFCRGRAQNGAATQDSAPSNDSEPIPGPPVSTSAPAVTGEPRVGAELRCRPGTWTGSPTVVPSFRRISADGAVAQVSSGSATYVPGAADAGALIMCAERATNSTGSNEAQSEPVGPVAVATAEAPATVPAPQVPPAPAPAPAPTRASPVPPPGPVGVSIDGGARYTDDDDVVLSVVWPLGATTALIGNDGGLRTARSLPLQARIPWKLDSSGAERLPKTVYLRFDGGLQTFTDDIVLDETAPTLVSARAVRGAGAGRRPVLVLRVRDATSGVSQMQVARTTRRPGRFRAYRSRVGAPIRARSVVVRVRDRAGNVSRWRRVRLPR